MFHSLKQKMMSEKEEEDYAQPPPNDLPSYAEAGPSGLQSQSNSGPDQFDASNKDQIIKITLKSSRFPNADPTFEPGDVVEGTLHLDLDKPQKIQQLSIHLKGRSRSQIIIYYGNSTEVRIEKWKIVDEKVVFWSENSMGGVAMDGDKVAAGSYTFPFRFQLPTSGNYVRTRDLKQFKKSSNLNPETRPYETLPPSFTACHELNYERVYYHLKAIAQRSAVRANHKVKLAFLISPPAPQIRRSKLFAEALSQAIFPPGPEMDAEGWVFHRSEMLAKTTFRGTLGRLGIELATPSPAIYPIGTTIPFILRISFLDGKDDRIVKKINVALRRRLVVQVPYLKRKFHADEFDATVGNIMVNDRNVGADAMSFHARDQVKTIFGQLDLNNMKVVTPSFETPNLKLSWWILIDLDVPGIGNDEKIEVPIELSPNATVLRIPKHYNDSA